MSLNNNTLIELYVYNIVWLSRVRCVYVYTNNNNNNNNINWSISSQLIGQLISLPKSVYVVRVFNRIVQSSCMSVCLCLCLCLFVSLCLVRFASLKFVLDSHLCVCVHAFSMCSLLSTTFKLSSHKRPTFFVLLLLRWTFLALPLARKDELCVWRRLRMNEWRSLARSW